MTHQRPALDFIAELRRGRAHAELTEALHEVMASVQDTGKKGELILKITVSPVTTSEYETPQVEVTDSITVKRPRRSVLPSRFFLTDDHNPVRRDPHQEAFEPLREVPLDDTDTTPSTADRKAN